MWELNIQPPIHFINKMLHTHKHVHTPQLFAVYLFVFCLMNFKLNIMQFGKAAHAIRHTEEQERDTQRDNRMKEREEGREDRTPRRREKRESGN